MMLLLQWNVVVAGHDVVVAVECRSCMGMS
jgi:hypothetical protein